MIVGDGSPHSVRESTRDIVIRPVGEGQPLQKISELNQWYDAMSYVLMFSYGSTSWNIETVSSSTRKHVTAMNYYAFRLMIRGNSHCIHLFGNLFQQFIVDMYIR